MNWNEFTAIPNGTKVLNHGWDQCVALANLYNEDVIGGEFVPVASAYQWWTDFPYFPQLRDNYTLSDKPAPGAIFVSRYGLYDAPNGHIGVVTGVNVNGTFDTMEQNAGTWRYVGRYTRDMRNMRGFLVPKKNPAKQKPATKPNHHETPSSITPGDDDMNEILVDNKHYYTVGKQFVSHNDSVGQADIAGRITGKTHKIPNKEFLLLLQAFGVPVDVVKDGTVKNPQSGKFERNGTWSREREILAKIGVK